MSYEQSAWSPDLSSNFWLNDDHSSLTDQPHYAQRQQPQQPLASLSHQHYQQPPAQYPDSFFARPDQNQFASNYNCPLQPTPSASLHAALSEGADFLPRSSNLPRLPRLPRHGPSSANTSSFGYIPSHFFYSPPQSPQDPVHPTQTERPRPQPITQESVQRSISDHALTTFGNSNPIENILEHSTAQQTHQQPLVGPPHESVAASSTMSLPTASTSAAAARKRRRPSGSNDSGPSPVRRRIDPTITHIDLSDSDEDDDINETPEDKDILNKEREALVAKQREESSKTSRIGELNCMICLEHFTNMTATFCGHIFCHECLTQALTASQRSSDHNYGTCPACRKPIRPGKKNQVIPLALMTAKKRK